MNQNNQYRNKDKLDGYGDNSAIQERKLQIRVLPELCVTQSCPTAQAGPGCGQRCPNGHACHI